MTKKYVCVFAGASTPRDIGILDDAKKLGSAIGQAGYDVIYGGGTGGVMGACAKAAQENGSHIMAVTVPEYADEEQFDNASVIVAKDKFDRFDKMAFANNPLASFVLPGGPGTFSEAAQALEGAIYGGGAPVILYGDEKYLSGISDYFNTAMSAGMIKPEKAACLQRWDGVQSLDNVLNFDM